MKMVIEGIEDTMVSFSLMEQFSMAQLLNNNTSFIDYLLTFHFTILAFKKFGSAMQGTKRHNCSSLLT